MSSQSERSTIPTQLNRIGKHSDAIQYPTNEADQAHFIEWLEGTQWKQKMNGLPEKSKEKKKISWGKPRVGARGWEWVIEAAQILDGTPCVICKRCDLKLQHPQLGVGTSGMTAHLNSKGCKTTAKVRGHSQMPILEGFRQQVLPTFLPTYKY